MTQLDSIALVLREVLGATVLGAYPHGSTATGRLQPTSDLDVLAVTSRPMDAGERERLTAELLARSRDGVR